MRLHLKELELNFKKGNDCIVFEDFSYFFGQMGAGKSTIARLIDYCFGGELGANEMTPALQSELVSVNLALQVENTPLNLRRDAGSNHIRAQWALGEELLEVMVPARKADGEVIEGSGVEVISDLLYFLAGKTPPKVRKGKLSDDSELGRLSLRDLLWYCYLDQDSMDSSFFHLEGDGDNWKRLKSRDVLRFIVGYYQETVSELEIKLDQLKAERLKCEAGATALRDALSTAEIASEKELALVRSSTEERISGIESSIRQVREQVSTLRPHAMDSLQEKARILSIRISELEQVAIDIKDVIAKDKAHKNELLSLSTRFRRSQSAREILGGVDFKACPCCNLPIPSRSEAECPVCGQAKTEVVTGALDEAAAEKDLDNRVAELIEMIARHEAQLRKNERLIRERRDEKQLADTELNRIAIEYDSAYLSAALEMEKERSALQQQLLDLKKLECLVQKIADLADRAARLVVEEKQVRSELKDARSKAEGDTLNLERLKTLFLDCLLRAKLPGFYPDDVVEMKPPNFLPEVTSVGLGNLAVTSFSNLGSGGKKTLFKCCFAIAIHRLAVELNALLPTVLIIDSPMKNISERENREQFEGFFEMLYDLSNSELGETQFILIDKELCSPPEGYGRSFSQRHMTPNERHEDPGTNPTPPLIRYYKGK